ncbi:MAG: polymer-forming cytoskeletal protein [Candidatus Schekmanbacteria bacterium]|nr:polymer-forming cytoskeletal protein [Candidatus Schekmanbacteria bacterium]
MRRLLQPDPPKGGGICAFLGPGAIFDGELRFQGTVRIDGALRGSVRSEGHLVIGDEGTVDADIEVGSISVSGKVSGTITAKEKIELLSPARVYADLDTPTLSLEPGVLFQGACKMSHHPSSTDKTSPPSTP